MTIYIYIICYIAWGSLLEVVPFTDSEFWSHPITGRRHLVPLLGGATKRSAADAGRFIVGGKVMCCHGEDMFHFFLSHIIVYYYTN